MKKPRYVVLGLLLICTLFSLSACTIRLADLSVVATQNVNLDKVDLDSLPQTKGIRGQDYYVSLIRADSLSCCASEKSSIYIIRGRPRLYEPSALTPRNVNRSSDEEYLIR